MTKITMSNLKTPTFDPSIILNHSIDDSSYEINEIIDDLDQLLQESESLKEALYFKISKIKTGVDCSFQEDKNIYYERLEAAMREIKIDSNDCFSDFLRRKRQIIENKQILSILNHFVKEKNNPDIILNSLLDSDNIDDLLNLSRLIFVSLRYQNMFNKDCYTKYSKRLKDKVSGLFKKSIERNDVQTSKKCVYICNIISEDESLVERFLLSTKIIDQIIHVTPITLTNLDLDRRTFDLDRFDSYIDNLCKLIKSKNELFFKIFGVNNRYQDLLVSKTIHLSIIKNLESFLNVNNPGIFLFSIFSARSKLHEFVDFISHIFTGFNCKPMIDMLFDQFASKSAMKETALFEEIFNAFLYGESTHIEYYILGEIVTKSKDYPLIYSKILILIDDMLLRASIYSKDAENEVLSFMYNKMVLLIDKLVLKSEDISKTADNLRLLYFLTRRFFKSQDHVLVEKIQNSLNDIFNLISDQNIKYLKHTVENLTFNDTKAGKEIVDRMFQIQKDFGILCHSAFYNGIQKIIDYVFDLITNQIQKIVFDSNKILNFVDLSSKLCIFAEGCHNNKIENKFKLLVIISKMIGIEKSSFELEYIKYENEITESILKVILKCRNEE